MERRDFVEVVLKSRVGGRDAAGFREGRFALGKKAENGAGHGDAMVAEAADFCAEKLGAAVDSHAVVVFGHRDAEGPQIRRHGGDAVGFLHAQFMGVADFGVAYSPGHALLDTLF